MSPDMSNGGYSLTPDVRVKAILWGFFIEKDAFKFLIEKGCFFQNKELLLLNLQLFFFPMIMKC